MIDIFFTFDTTGSMNPAIAEVRRKIKRTVSSLFRDIKGLRIGIIAHGDYIDHPNELSFLDLTSDEAKIVRFVNDVKRTYGGDGNEFYELVLNRLHTKPSWRPEAQKVAVMIGDAEPHRVGRTPDGFTCNHDWRHEARLLGEKGVKTHAVKCLGYRADFWKELASLGGGSFLRLEQFSHTTELVEMLAHHTNGSLSDYENSLGALAMNRGIANLLAELRGEAAKTPSVHRSGLLPVPLSRFQILSVDGDSAIRAFVEETGASFETGRGFYQLVKRELIQEAKEVVFEDKVTGEMFCGADARHMLGLPFGVRGKVSPKDIPEGYNVFVQSTSYNRKLKAGTRFLYEARRI